MLCIFKISYYLPLKLNWEPYRHGTSTTKLVLNMLVVLQVAPNISSRLPNNSTVSTNEKMSSQWSQLNA